LSQVVVTITVMEKAAIDEAITWLEKANAELDPELLPAPIARKLLGTYAPAERLASFGKTVLARKLDDATEVASATGTSVGKAKVTLDTGRALRDADATRDAFRMVTSPWTRQPRSQEPSRLIPAVAQSSCRSPTRSPFTS
jgi:hypothetical protein